MLLGEDVPIPNVNNERISLVDVLEQISVEQNRPMSVVEFVELAFEAGYRIDAVLSSNLVLMVLKTLTKRGVFMKDDTTCQYHGHPHTSLLPRSEEKSAPLAKRRTVGQWRPRVPPNASPRAAVSEFPVHLVAFVAGVGS